jgi:hypothetical protein
VVVYDDISSAEEDVSDSDSDDGFDTFEEEIPDKQEVPSENVDDLMKDCVTFYDDNDITSPKVNEQLAISWPFPRELFSPLSILSIILENIRVC